MGERLYELLRHCTAIVSIDGKEIRSSGSGFFVAPGLLLTCAHVIGNEQSSPEEIEVFWNRQSDQASNEKVDVDADWTKKPYKVLAVTVKGDIDLALLRVDITTDHPCVWLTKEETLPDEELYNFGYPFRNSDSDSDRGRGEPANYFLEGKTSDAIGLLKFNGAHIMKGQSGSPLLSKDSGYVCAVVKKRLSPDNPFGGLAISAATVLQVFPELETRQQLFHRTDQRWMDCLWENTGFPKGDLCLQLLQKVRKDWIKQVLEERLGKVAYILLGLSELPEAVENPLRLPKRQADQSEHRLRLHTTITQVYDESIDGSLLILGEPGGGKTTLLLELARNLLERARRDSFRSPTPEPNNRHPIPVVFDLSTWAARQQSLADWLMEELWKNYGISRTVSESWIGNNQVLPLLDGLDEVRPNALTACVKAINTYRQEHNSLPTVVCCNRAAYFLLSERLYMQCAVVVQPLTTEQIDKCLESAGPQLERLRSAHLNDPVMQELLTTPLMLNMLMAIISDDRDLLTSGPLEGQQIFAKYVQRTFKDKIARSRYTSTQAIHWLSYLAKQLDGEELKVFSVENLQPSWLQNSSKFLYHMYNWCIGSIYGLIFGLPIILVGGQLVIGGQPSSLPFVIFIWLVLGFVCGVLYPIRSMRIRPAETITWSWKDFRSGFVLGLVLGLVPGTILGTILSTSMGWPEGMSLVNGLLYYVTTIGIYVGIIFGIILGTIFGLFRGLFPKQLIVRENLLPNSGIRRSIKNGVIFGLLLCPIVMMVVAFVFWRLAEYNAPGALEQTLVIGLIVGLYIGLIFALNKGLGAFVQHYLFRFLLWCTNCLPWKLVQFLDEMARLHLLYKMGGNYKFWHLSFLGYFAALNASASSAPKKASISLSKGALSPLGRLVTGLHPGPISRLRLVWQITLRVLLALLIISTAGLALGFWKPAQQSSPSLPEPFTPTPSVVTVESSPQVIINSTDLLPTSTLTEFSRLSNGDVEGMIIGPDDNLWFANNPVGYASGESLIGLITPSGKITEFALPTEGQAYGITKGPDGNLWFAENGIDKIGRISPTGNITEFTLPTKPDTNGSEPEGITTGPDGNLWFTEANGNAIGRITPTGNITEFALPTAQSYPEEITADPDGNLWFTEVDGDAIGRITPTGKITEFALSTYPKGITTGPDGNLWFTEANENVIGRITPTGNITEFTLPSTTISPEYIVFGPKAHLWFADNNNDAIGYMTSTQFNK